MFRLTSEFLSEYMDGYTMFFLPPFSSGLPTTACAPSSLGINNIVVLGIFDLPGVK